MDSRNLPWGAQSICSPRGEVLEEGERKRGEMGMGSVLEAGKEKAGSGIQRMVENGRI